MPVHRLLPPLREGLRRPRRLAEGKLSQTRYDSYCAMYDEVKDVKESEEGIGNVPLCYLSRLPGQRLAGVGPAAGDTIIACDAGYRNCGPLHCRPDIIVGDFDTAPCPAQEGGDTIILPHVKDDTDTEYAAKLASEKGFDEALLLGALGGRRLEHTLANLCTGLGLEQRGVRATLLDERSRITFVMPGRDPPLPEG